MYFMINWLQMIIESYQNYDHFQLLGKFWLKMINKFHLQKWMLDNINVPYNRKINEEAAVLNYGCLNFKIHLVLCVVCMFFLYWDCVTENNAFGTALEKICCAPHTYVRLWIFKWCDSFACKLRKLTVWADWFFIAVKSLTKVKHQQTTRV